MIDESHVLDAPLALTIICCCLIGLAILTRRQPPPPISMHARRRLNERIEEQENLP